MCGLTGFVDLRRATSPEDLTKSASAMAATIAHRGPDDSGVWTDAQAGIAIAHRRLSIIELSEAGAQPMVSATGRYVLAYNGEIYNYSDLRARLAAEGHGPFRGDSDTEIVLEACEAWGIATAVQSFVGMFGFVLWDRDTLSLTLVRDRVGIKPLYWARFQSFLLFGSQSKSFTAHPAFRAEIDQTALATFLRFAYVPAPMSIYRGVEQLQPGTIMTFSAKGNVSTRRYWDACAIAQPNVPQLKEEEDERSAVRKLEALLHDAVSLRMRSDVPIGAFLSGGIDSSTVVAIMQQLSIRPAKTFSIGFDLAGYNEAHHAKRVATHLGTEHTELYLSPSDAIDVIPQLSSSYDEPFADSSQIPTTLVAMLARRHVKVSLSGDGGDELFGGYTRYVLGEKLRKSVERVPKWIRSALANTIKGLSPEQWNRLARVLPDRLRPAQFGSRFHKLADVVQLDNADSIYMQLVTQWADAGDLITGAEETALPPAWQRINGCRCETFTQRMQLLDLITYLPDDILAKIDRASMAVSLEARVPLLDHRVVEFALQLPHKLKVRNTESKWLLRQVLYRHVPRRLIDRPKMGFGVPIGEWLRGPLRDWAEDLLDEKQMRSDGFFNPDPIQKRWRQHLSGAANWQYPLWVILVFQDWQRRWLR